MNCLWPARHHLNAGMHTPVQFQLKPAYSCQSEMFNLERRDPERVVVAYALSARLAQYREAIQRLVGDLPLIQHVVHLRCVWMQRLDRIDRESECRYLIQFLAREARSVIGRADSVLPMW